MTELRPTQPDGLREPTMCPRRCGGRCGRATRAAARLWARMAGAPSVASWSSITFSRLPTAAGRPRVIFSCAGARTMPMRRRCTLCPRSCERPRLHPTAWLGPAQTELVKSCRSVVTVWMKDRCAAARCTPTMRMALVRKRGQRRVPNPRAAAGAPAAGMRRRRVRDSGTTHHLSDCSEAVAASSGISVASVAHDPLAPVRLTNSRCLGG
jgi:hypothetical protein